jgi:hydroxyethylthiazole kinase-like uncharacterized protein yjeF
MSPQDRAEQDPGIDRSDDAVIVTPQALRDWPLPQPGRDSNKGERGSTLVVGGSPTTVGAVLLAGIATLRAGAGKLAIMTAASTAPALAVALPEALVAGVPVDDQGGLAPATFDQLEKLASGTRSILIGPGMTGPQATARLLERFLPLVPSASVVVLDALALTSGAVTSEALRRFDGNVILTPNDVEAERMTSREPGVDIGHGQLAREIASEFEAVVALRGAVAAPDGRAWYGQTGHAGLGTSGSGDVLAGLITGLAAREMPPEQSAVWGVHLHGEAGERLAARVGRLGFLARELLDEVPGVMMQLES